MVDWCICHKERYASCNAFRKLMTCPKIIVTLLVLENNKFIRVMLCYKQEIWNMHL